MLGRNDAIRISQTALNKAGAYKLQATLDKQAGENLAGLLKYMVENSAIASGRRRNPNRSKATRRRYGDFVVILKGHTVVDLIASRPDWCQICLGVHRGTGDCDCK